MLADQIFQAIDYLGFGDVEFHSRFAHVEIHFARRAANVTKIGVSHFARTVNDAAYHCNLYALQVRGSRSDFGPCSLQVEKRPGEGRLAEKDCTGNRLCS